MFIEQLTIYQLEVKGRDRRMIYQEINLPIWGQLVLMAVLILLLLLLAHIKPLEDVKEENDKIPTIM